VSGSFPCMDSVDPCACSFRDSASNPLGTWLAIDNFPGGDKCVLWRPVCGWKDLRVAASEWRLWSLKERGRQAHNIRAVPICALLPRRPESFEVVCSPAVSDAGLETLVRPALALPPFARGKIAAPLACYPEFLAAPSNAGAAPISHLRLSRREYAHTNCEQQH
jgi:hypothetical protein